MKAGHASPEIDGAKLRKLRKEAGLSVSEAARKIGISVSYVSAIERGARLTVHPAMFNQICAAMGVERSELLRADDADAA